MATLMEKMSDILKEFKRCVATPQAERGWAAPICRPFKIQSCCCLGSAFEVAAFQTLGFHFSRA
jgi:hypothetical protein